MKQVKNEKLLKQIAVRLKELREEKDLTQAEVYADTDNIHIARIEQGKVNISVSTLDELCKYYKISLEDFFKGIPQSTY